MSLGAVFTIFAGFYYWFPKMTGYMYDEKLGESGTSGCCSSASTWCSSRSISSAWPACRAATSTIPTPIALWNFVSSIGALVALVATVVFLYTVYEAFAKKRVAGANPWGVAGATTLEWTLPSPPPFHQYETLPQIAGAEH